jgi:predicted acylesterase/phospholipase RssA
MASGATLPLLMATADSSATPPSSKYLILACDGGGIRGLVTALLLDDLSTRHPGFLSQTYLNAGTSTGGIISLGLACGVSTGQLVDLYRNDGGRIFTTSTCRGVTSAARPVPDPVPLRGMSAQSWWQFILQYLSEVVCPWYDNTSLKGLLEGQLDAQAHATLNSLVDQTNPRYVLVNTLQLCTSGNAWTPLHLTNLPPLHSNGSGETRVIDAAMSTGAAPMYFPPYEHPTYGYCADGGLFANNPGTLALTTLMRSGVPLDTVWMLSLSTGNTQNCYPASIINAIGASSFGPIYWIWPVSRPDPAVPGQPYTPSLPLMDVVFDATSQMDSEYCAQLLPGRYKRANVPLAQPIALDDCSPAAIASMTSSTSAYMQSSGEWADIQSWIQTNFPSRR